MLLRTVGLLLLAATLLLPAASRAGEVLEILAFGDSLVHGYGLPAGDSFPAQLEAALKAEGEEARVINAGNSGDTTAAGRSRLEWSLAEEPDAVILVLGGNDALRGLDPARTYENLAAILETLEDRDLPVLLAGMKAPRNLGADYIEAFDSVFPRLAERYDLVFYPFFLEGVATRPALNQADGIHPNAKGVAEIVERILPDVQRLIERARR